MLTASSGLLLVARRSGRVRRRFAILAHFSASSLYLALPDGTG